jgi:hypothetical protein
MKKMILFSIIVFIFSAVSHLNAQDLKSVLDERLNRFDKTLNDFRKQRNKLFGDDQKNRPRQTSEETNSESSSTTPQNLDDEKVSNDIKKDDRVNAALGKIDGKIKAFRMEDGEIIPEYEEYVEVQSSISQHLPSRSYVKIRFLTGPVAPATGLRGGNEPVTAILINRFVTPDNISINIGKSCRMGGIAHGNAPMSRIFIDATEIVCVKKDGTIWRFPKELNSTKSIGYIGGNLDLNMIEDNYMGIAAKKVSNEGSLLLLKFVLEIIGDFSNFFAESMVEESETQVGIEGKTSELRNVKEKDRFAYAIGKGLGNQSIPSLNQFIMDLLAQALPYLYAEAYSSAYLYTTTRIDISGLINTIKMSKASFEAGRL